MIISSINDTDYLSLIFYGNPKSERRLSYFLHICHIFCILSAYFLHIWHIFCIFPAYLSYFLHILCFFVTNLPNCKQPVARSVVSGNFNQLVASLQPVCNSGLALAPTHHRRRQLPSSPVQPWQDLQPEGQHLQAISSSQLAADPGPCFMFPLKLRALGLRQPPAVRRPLQHSLRRRGGRA